MLRSFIRLQRHAKHRNVSSCMSKCALQSICEIVAGFLPESQARGMSNISDASLQAVNDYAATHHQGCLECVSRPQKGRILVSRRLYSQGDLILVERPLHIVQEEADAEVFRDLKSMCEALDFDFEPLWYWAAVRSLTATDLGANSVTPLDEERQARLLTLHHGDAAKPCEAVTAISKKLLLTVDITVKLERLLQVWAHNAFDYSDEPTGYATYYFPSFMSHSCYPNAFWHYDGDSYVLRARRDIAVGDEVLGINLIRFIMASTFTSYEPGNTVDRWASSHVPRCGGTSAREKFSFTLHPHELRHVSEASPPPVPFSLGPGSGHRLRNKLSLDQVSNSLSNSFFDVATSPYTSNPKRSHVGSSLLPCFFSCTQSASRFFTPFGGGNSECCCHGHVSAHFGRAVFVPSEANRPLFAWLFGRLEKYKQKTSFFVVHQVNMPMGSQWKHSAWRNWTCLFRAPCHELDGHHVETHKPVGSQQ